MHKYKPRVHVMEQDSRVDLSWIQSLPAEGVKTFSFKETEFTTVTAYQNQQVKLTRSQASKDGPRGTYRIEASCTMWTEFPLIFFKRSYCIVIKANLIMNCVDLVLKNKKEQNNVPEEK